MDIRSPGSTNALISSALEKAAEECGLSVTRLTEESIICHVDEPMIFWGGVGPSTAEVTRNLCRRSTWLRWYLRSWDVPVAESDSPERAHVVVVGGTVIADTGIAHRVDRRELRAAAQSAIKALPMLQYGCVSFGDRSTEDKDGTASLGVVEIDVTFHKWVSEASDESVAELAAAVIQTELNLEKVRPSA